jgi:hypothetical protein
MALFESAQWSSFQCHALVVHTAWSAAAAFDLSSAYRREVARLKTIAAERMHWARCRHGLERRARRSNDQWLARQWHG